MHNGTEPVRRTQQTLPPSVDHLICGRHWRHAAPRDRSTQRREQRSGLALAASVVAPISGVSARRRDSTCMSTRTSSSASLDTTIAPTRRKARLVLAKVRPVPEPLRPLGTRTLGIQWIERRILSADRSYVDDAHACCCCASVMSLIDDLNLGARSAPDRSPCSQGGGRGRPTTTCMNNSLRWHYPAGGFAGVISALA